MSKQNHTLNQTLNYFVDMNAAVVFEELSVFCVAVQQDELRTETRRKNLLILIYHHLLGQGSVYLHSGAANTYTVQYVCSRMSKPFNIQRLVCTIVS